MRTKKKDVNKDVNHTLGDPRGGARDAPGGPNSFIFMQFSGKIFEK